MKLIPTCMAVAIFFSAGGALAQSADTHNHREMRSAERYAELRGRQLTFGYNSVRAFELQVKREQLRQMPWEHWEDLINTIVGFYKEFQTSSIITGYKHIFRTGPGGAQDITRGSSNSGTRDDWGNNSN